MTHVGSEVSLSRLELVVLARLSSAELPGPKDLGDAVSKLVLPSETPARARQRALETLEQLWRRGLVAAQPARKRKSSGKPSSKRKRRTRRASVAQAKPGRRLTSDGERALCRAFGVDAPPTWRQVRDVHLPALGVGLAPGSDAAHSNMASGRAMVAMVLRSELGVHGASTVAELCDTLIIQALGLSSGQLTLQRIRAHVLAGRLGIDAKGSAGQIAARAVSARLGARDARKSSLARALARRWASQYADGAGAPAQVSAAPQVVSAKTPADVAAPAPVALSAEALLAMVRDAIPAIGRDGRHGPDKVFVSALWRQISQDARLLDYTLERFKRWLVAANRDRLLDLARADLVGAMDPRLVAESEIADIGATFHFVLDRHVHSLGSDRRSHAR